MNNYEVYTQIFTKLFNVENQELKNLKYQGIDEWDSVGHMELVSELEDAFDIEFETDDIIDFNSFEKGIEILKNNYNIDISEE